MIKKLDNTQIKNCKIETYEIDVENDLIETFEKSLKELNINKRVCLYIDDNIKSSFTDNIKLIINDIRHQIKDNKYSTFKIKYLDF